MRKGVLMGEIICLPQGIECIKSNTKTYNFREGSTFLWSTLRIGTERTTEYAGLSRVFSPSLDSGPSFLMGVSSTGTHCQILMLSAFQTCLQTWIMLPCLLGG